MKLLILSEKFPPVYNAAGISAARIAKYMLRVGHDVKIVSGSPRDSDTELLHDDRELDQCTTFVPRREYRVSKGRLGMITSALKTGLWEYSARWVPEGIEGAVSVIQTWRPDLLFSRSEPFSSHLVAFRMSRRFGIPWVASFGDPWPRFLYPPPYQLQCNAITAMHLNRWQGRVLRECKGCIFPTDSIRDIMMKSAMPDVATKAVVIPHVAPERMQPADFGPQAKLTILHAGSIPDERFPTGLASGIARLVHRKPTVRQLLRIHFVGRICEKLISSFKEEGIGEMIDSQPPVPYGVSLQLARSADILLLIEADMRESIFLPSKFVDYVSTSRPILALSPRKGPVASFLARGGGAIAPPNDPEAVGAVVESLYDAWMAGTLGTSFSSEGLYDSFSAETLGPMLLNCFHGATHRPNFGIAE